MRKFAPAGLLSLAWGVMGRGRNSGPEYSVGARKARTKLHLPGLGIVVLLAFAPAVMAQDAINRPLPRRAVVAAPAYNLASEITVQGAIQSVVKKPTTGLMYGGHLMVTTAQGTVDAQIGKFLLRGPHAPSFTTGQQVRLVGTMTTFHGHAVLLVRLIQTSNGTITVRNERGGVIVPLGKKSAIEASSTGGAL